MSNPASGLHRFPTQKSLFLAMAAVPFLVVAMSMPVRAVDVVTAVDACGKIPGCKASFAPGGWLDIWVGDNWIQCDTKGEQTCSCVDCGHPYKTTKGKDTKTVIGILGIPFQASGKTSKPVVRDHRTKPVKRDHRPIVSQGSRPKSPLGGGILDSSPGFGSQGPAGTGSPATPSAPTTGSGKIN